MNSAASIRKPTLGALAVSSFFAMFVLVAQPAGAQQVTGTLGQAAATTTINGEQIPETCRTGCLRGFNQYTAYNGILSDPAVKAVKAMNLLHYDDWGSDKTYPHMAVPWAWAFDTPFKWTKQIASHFGGTRQGLAISWPGHIKDPGGIRTQFHHVIDIVPTILEATGIPAPDMVNGIKQKPIEGVSMTYTFDSANANAPSKRDTQYFEMFGNRALYHDGWLAATVPPQPPWLMGTVKM